MKIRKIQGYKFHIKTFVIHRPKTKSRFDRLKHKIIRVTVIYINDYINLNMDHR